MQTSYIEISELFTLHHLVQCLWLSLGICAWYAYRYCDKRFRKYKTWNGHIIASIFSQIAFLIGLFLICRLSNYTVAWWMSLGLGFSVGVWEWFIPCDLKDDVNRNIPKNLNNKNYSTETVTNIFTSCPHCNAPIGQNEIRCNYCGGKK
jgi:hypothetical protein